MTSVQTLPNVHDPWKLGPVTAQLMRMIGFEPTGEEQAAILRCRRRFKAISGGGQSGKSTEAAADFMVHLFEDRVKWPWPQHTLRYWLLAADYERTRSEFDKITDALIKYGLPAKVVDPSKRLDPGEIRVRFPHETRPRVLIQTKSGKDPRTLAMYSPHGIICCEASQLDFDTWEKTFERVTASGGWIHASGTYETSYGWYPGVVASWAYGREDRQSFVLPTPSNKVLFPGGINDPKIQTLKRDSSDDFFLEKIMGIAAPPRGIVFPEFNADIHIRPVEYDPNLPLYIWADPGYGHAYAVLIAQVAQGGQVQIKDEIYERGRISEEIITICKQRAWWKNDQKTLVLDPNYARQHQGTHSVAEIWLEEAKLATMDVRVGIQEGIERTKSFLKVNPITGAPGIVFNPSCKGILSELGAYPSPFYENPRWEVYSWKSDREGNIIGDSPDDRFNDGCKALVYGLVERFGLIAQQGYEHFVMQRHVDSSRRSRRLEAIRERQSR